MRAAVADYVTALHRAYLGAGRHVPARRARADALAHRRPGCTVAAVGARNLHLLATGRGARARCRARRSRWTGEAAGSPGAALLRPGGAARARPDRGGRRAGVRGGPAGPRRRRPSSTTWSRSPGRRLSAHHADPRRHRPGQRALRRGPRLRDDPLPRPRPRGAGRRAGRAPRDRRASPASAQATCSARADLAASTTTARPRGLLSRRSRPSPDPDGESARRC